MVATLPELKNFAENFAEDCFAFDCETTSLDISKVNIVCITLANDNFSEIIKFKFTGSYYIQKPDPANKRRKIKVEIPYAQNEGIDIREAQSYLAELFRGKKVVGANLKYDTKLAMKFGFFTYSLQDDTQVQAYILDNREPQNLKYNVKKHLGIEMISYEEASDSAKITVDGEKILNVIWTTVDWGKYFDYALRDAVTTWKLNKYFNAKLQAEPGLLNCYRNIEMPLIEVTAEMEFTGVTVDVNYLRKAGVKIAHNIAKHEQEVYKLAGVKFNIGSSQQLADVLFNRLGYKSTAKTDKGAPSTDEKTIKLLAYQGYPVADELLRYKKLVKLKSTYIDAIPELIHADNRLRCSFNQTFTSTGRFSSSNPNAQNIPARESEYRIREAFKAAKGKVFIGGDYSQLELRVMAHISKDTTLLRAYHEGLDLHQITADSISKQAVEITRHEGKNINFSLVFGMGGFALAEKLNEAFRDLVKAGKMTQTEYAKRSLTSRQGQKLIDAWYATYPGYAAAKARFLREFKKLGYAYTMNGRRRALPDLNSRDYGSQGAAEREAMSTLIQGTAADLVKLGMGKAYQALKGTSAKFLMQIHDELIVECDKGEAETVKEILRREMENAMQLEVPLIFETAVYDNWSELKTGRKKKDDFIFSLLW